MSTRDQTRPNWPAWYGLAGLGMALVLTVLASTILVGALKAAGANVDGNSSGITITATLIQDAALAASAIWLAAQTARPRPWHFGLRGTPLLRAVKWMAIGFAIYFLFQLVYVAAVKPDQEQSTLRDLGAGNGGSVTILVGFMVVVVAPVFEEFFFRGFFYGALRNHFTFLTASLLAGGLFGLIHAPSGIEAVPPLMVLGFAFCLIYEATGSILPAIGLHALNNMVAFGADKDGNWAVAGVFAGLVLAACVTLPARLRTL